MLVVQYADNIQGHLEPVRGVERRSVTEMLDGDWRSVTPRLDGDCFSEQWGQWKASELIVNCPRDPDRVVQCNSSKRVESWYPDWLAQRNSRIQVDGYYTQTKHKFDRRVENKNMRAKQNLSCDRGLKLVTHQLGNYRFHLTVSTSTVCAHAGHCDRQTPDLPQASQQPIVRRNDNKQTNKQTK